MHRPAILAVRTIIFIGPPAALRESCVLIMSSITHRRNGLSWSDARATGYAAAAIFVAGEWRRIGAEPWLHGGARANAADIPFGARRRLFATGTELAGAIGTPHPGRWPAVARRCPGSWSPLRGGRAQSDRNVAVPFAVMPSPRGKVGAVQLRGRNQTVTDRALHEVGRRGRSEQPHDLGLVILGRTYGDLQPTRDDLSPNDLRRTIAVLRAVGV